MIGPNTLWISGGEDPQPTGTSELVSLVNGTLSTYEGPQLPIDVLGHCVVNISKNGLEMFMMIGGFNNYIGDTNKTFIYGVTFGWIDGPDLNIPRRVHACGILNVNDTRYVVVTGGASKQAEQSVEILDLNNIEQGWVSGPYLPKPLFAHSMVSTENSLVIIGGIESSGDGDKTSDEFYEMTYSNVGFHFMKMEQKLKSARANMVAMLVPDDITNCEF